jgi:hypothetical protein
VHIFKRVKRGERKRKKKKSDMRRLEVKKWKK